MWCTTSLWDLYNPSFPKIGAPTSFWLYIIHLFFIIVFTNKRSTENTLSLLLQEIIPSENEELSYTPSSLVHSVVEI